MAVDPSTFFAKCFATWLRLQILMAFLMAWILALMGLSAYATTSGGGDFSNVSVPAPNGTTTQPYTKWADVCNSSPYLYLRPFQFTYTDAKGNAFNNYTYCSFPYSLSVFRIVICCASLLTIFLLFFNTPLSFFAREVWIVYALLYFAAFVLDCNAVQTGYTSCVSNFGDTNLHDAIVSLGLTVNCSENLYPGLAIIDLIVTGHFFLIYTAWHLATDHYVKKGQQQAAPAAAPQPAVQYQYAPQPQPQVVYAAPPAAPAKTSFWGSSQPAAAPAPMPAPAPASTSFWGSRPAAPAPAPAPAPASTGSSFFGGGKKMTVMQMQAAGAVAGSANPLHNL
jgi:hypothetical protein